MIVSASYRTDIPAFYADWFRRRLRAGWCRVANPYGGPDYRVPLAGPDLDGFVFWTRNVAPFRPVLAEIRRAGPPFAVHYTITGYPTALERAVGDAGRAVGHCRLLSREFGARSVVWRYDPILISDLTPADWHRRMFRDLAARLSGHCDEVVTSFAQIYRKTRRNLDRAAGRNGFAWRDPEPEDKRRLLADLAEIAAGRGMALTLCSQPELAVDGVAASRCIDAARLSDLAGRPIRSRTRGNRPGCLCSESRDIGAYDTCPHGCVYCYAVRDRATAVRAVKAHDPGAPGLKAGKTVS